MKTSDVIKQLQLSLPRYTTEFSDQLAITSIVPSGTTATATLAVTHTLEVGDIVTISGAIAPVEIASISRSETVATATTVTNHDITENAQTTQVTLSGTSETEFNGTFELLSANNRRTFEFAVDDSGPTAATGGLLEDPPGAFGYNGQHVITGGITPTAFEYTLPVVLTQPAIGSGVVHTAIQVTGAASEDRIEELYTASSSLWAIVVLGETTASGDRNSRNDAITSAAPAGDRDQTIYQNFSIYVISTVSDELTSRATRDSMEDIMLPLFQSLLFWKAPTGLADTQNMGVVFFAHGTQDSTSTHYIHRFDFQLVSKITRSDTLEPDFNVAFRDIGLTMGTTLGTQKLTINIDLDDEPL